MGVEDLVQLEAFAMVALHLSRSDYWASTPDEFKGMVKAHERLVEQTDRRVARILSLLYNINRKRGTQPTKEQDWMPRVVKRQTAEEMRRVVHQLHAMMA